MTQLRWVMNTLADVNTQGKRKNVFKNKKNKFTTIHYILPYFIKGIDSEN